MNTKFEERELPCVNEKCKYNDHMFEQNCAAMIKDAGEPYIPYCKKYIAEGTNCAGESEMNTKFEELTRTNQLVAAVMNSGGTAEDCAVALVEMNDRLLKHLRQLSSITPRRITNPDGAVMIWRCPEDLIPEDMSGMGFGIDEGRPTNVISGRAGKENVTDKLELTGSCWFEDYGYGDISLCYTEHATDHWSSDSETTIDIDKEKAEKIIGWLQHKFNLMQGRVEVSDK